MSSYFVGILILDGLLLLGYFVRYYWFSSKPPQLAEAVTLVVTGAGSIPAVKLFIRLPSIAGTDDDRLCIAIGALSLLWVSVEAAVKVYKS